MVLDREAGRSKAVGLGFESLRAHQIPFSCFSGCHIGMNAAKAHRPRGVAQPGSASGLGPEGRRFESCLRSEEHTSELQSLMRISYAVFCLKKKNLFISVTDTLYSTLLYHILLSI